MQSSIKRGLVAGLFLFAVSAQAAPQRVLPDACDESCLLAIAGDYLDSLTANDPSGAPMASTLRATENGVVTPPGEGVWKTANAWNYRHTFVDPTTGGIGVFGIVNETGDKKAIVSVRLKVAARKIVESELLVVREGAHAMFEPTEREAKPSFYSFVPQEMRSTREELKAIAHSYFVGITRADPSLVPFHPDCNRIENGMQTTNNMPLMGTSCAEGLRRLGYMQSFRNLRYPVVDTKRGLVWAIVTFDMPVLNRTLSVRGKQYEIKPEYQHLPRTLFLSELFKVEGGKIRWIEAEMINAPLGAKMGWPDENK